MHPSYTQKLKRHRTEKSLGVLVASVQMHLIISLVLFTKCVCEDGQFLGFFFFFNVIIKGVIKKVSGHYSALTLIS